MKKYQHYIDVRGEIYDVNTLIAFCANAISGLIMLQTTLSFHYWGDKAIGIQIIEFTF